MNLSIHSFHFFSLLLLLALLFICSATATTVEGEDVCVSEVCELAGINIGYALGNVPCDPADRSCVESCTPLLCNEPVTQSTSLFPEAPSSAAPPTPTSKSNVVLDCNTSSTANCFTNLVCQLNFQTYSRAFGNTEVVDEGADGEIVYLTEGAEWSFRDERAVLSREVRSLTTAKGKLKSLSLEFRRPFSSPFTEDLVCRATTLCLDGPSECYTWNQRVVIGVSCQSPIVPGQKIGVFQIINPTVTNCSSSTSRGESETDGGE